MESFQFPSGNGSNHFCLISQQVIPIRVNSEVIAVQLPVRFPEVLPGTDDEALVLLPVSLHQFPVPS